LPLTGLFCLLVFLRRYFYRLGWLSSRRLPVPVIIVGNISVGGTGKTPLVVWVTQRLMQMGFKPGILLRGYGGRGSGTSQEVTAESVATEVGDEAVLIKRHLACPVFIGRDRAEAGERLLSNYACDLIVSDDGLQHYALQRDLEIVVVDGERRFGNGLCLPAGPLRESVCRLKRVDLVIVNGRGRQGEFSFRVGGNQAVPLGGGDARSLSSFTGERVEALAGIGHPERFFEMLRQAGLAPVCHAFPDHHPYQAEELRRFSDATVLMTEKDGVKCELFAPPNSWYVSASAEPDTAFQAAFETKIRRLIDG
jgi:tetraacyldisaccharide 4'-kinase